MEWIQFDVLELIEKRKWPRRVIRRYFEINPLGQVRYLEKSIPKYIEIKPAQINGRTYFMSPVGWSVGNLVVARFPIQDLVKRYFNL